MNEIFKFLTILPLSILFVSCGSKIEREEISIIYTNDIHGYIGNVDEIDNTKEGLRLSHIAGYVDNLKRNNQKVLLVDAGDEVQGSVYGAIDQGKEMIQIMNKCQFDVATPGNHDFDFGMGGFNYFVDTANYPYISCNFMSIPDEHLVLEPYKIFDIGGAKIGFIGISTPETITSSTPTFFQNDKGEYIYEFVGQSNANELYETVQYYVDEIREKVDVVIALAHTGVGADAIAVGQDSISIINHTSGIDAYIDGHSHTFLPCKEVTNKVGQTCLLTQTGSYLTHFGKLTIDKNNAIAVEMIDDSEFVNQDVHQLEEHLINEVQEQMNTKIATLENPLYIVNAENQKQRIIRARETNLGNFAADSIYWYFNEYKEIDCDLALVNGGGIRDNIFAKDVTYMDAKTVFPFGNQICLVKVKGSVIKDALEMGSCVIGQWDEVADRPAEFGGFFQPAGLKYDISASTISSVVLDETGMFVSVDGEYKVRNVEIYNKELQCYESLDEDKEYSVASFNYILRNDGNGMKMFHDSINIVDYVAEDYIVLAEFMKSFDNGVINNANSALKGYMNMLYDYETPTGSGRINIIE